MNPLAAFVLAAPLILSNSTETGFNFVMHQVKPAAKKSVKDVKVRLYQGDEFETKVESTPKTTHRIEARDSEGKVIACAVVTNASVVDLVQVPNGEYHFVCTGGDQTHEMVTCRLAHCDPK